MFRTCVSPLTFTVQQSVSLLAARLPEFDVHHNKDTVYLRVVECADNERYVMENIHSRMVEKNRNSMGIIPVNGNSRGQ